MSDIRTQKQDVRRQATIRKQRVGRRRRLQRKRNIFIGLFLICIVVLFTKGRIDTYKKNQDISTGGKVSNPDGEVGDATVEIDAVNDKVSTKINPPKDRNLEEILAELEKMSVYNKKIAEIYANHEAYPTEILGMLVNNPETLDFVAGYLEGKTIEKMYTSEPLGDNKVPLMLQWDQRWGYMEYGDSNIGLAGCGPTCLAMVVSFLTKDSNITPDVIAKYSEQNGHYVNGTGTSWALMTEGATNFGVISEEVPFDINAIKQRLDQGKVIITAVGPGDFTVAGHFIVIYGYNEEGFLINDPNCEYRSNIVWDFENLFEQIKMLWAYMI